MSKTQATDGHQENAAEPSPRTADSSGTDRSTDRRSETPKSREERLSEINQYFTLISSILSIASPTILTIVVAINNNINAIFWVIFGISMAALLIVSGSFGFKIKALKNENKLSSLNEEEISRDNYTEEQAGKESKNFTAKETGLIEWKATGEPVAGKLPGGEPIAGELPGGEPIAGELPATKKSEK